MDISRDLEWRSMLFSYLSPEKMFFFNIGRYLFPFTCFLTNTATYLFSFAVGRQWYRVLSDEGRVWADGQVIQCSWHASTRISCWTIGQGEKSTVGGHCENWLKNDGKLAENLRNHLRILSSPVWFVFRKSHTFKKLSLVVTVCSYRLLFTYHMHYDPISRIIIDWEG